MRREYHNTTNCFSFITGLPLHAQGILSAIGCDTAYPWDYPCMRREYEAHDQLEIACEGLPLHAQGILSLMVLLSSLYGITPACAGNTPVVLINSR